MKRRDFLRGTAVSIGAAAGAAVAGAAFAGSCPGEAKVLLPVAEATLGDDDRLTDFDVHDPRPLQSHPLERLSLPGGTTLVGRHGSFGQQVLEAELALDEVDDADIIQALVAAQGAGLHFPIRYAHTSGWAHADMIVTNSTYTLGIERPTWRFSLVSVGPFEFFAPE